jgi:ectoine hydroxylase-related dioxygenase (phytanoyl-CoA dioxygenase family)
MLIIPAQMNPDLTPDLEREVAFFLKWGYLVVENALTPAQLEDLRNALDETFDRLKTQFTGELLEQDERFGFLIDNPPVLKRIKAILGNCIQLHSATSRVTQPGEPDQNWHRDGPWPMDPNGTPYGSLPGQINCGYYLDEITMENGPIVIVPGSQRALFKPPEGHPRFPDEKYILAQPGQAVLFDGWLYHRGAANQSQQRRRVCLMCYQNAWMKSREPFDGPRVTKLREEGSPERKLLLGGIPKW